MRVIHVPFFESYLDTEIYYEEYGEKSATPLVLVTGLACNMLQWDPKLVDVLVQHYKVILIDNRGSGRSGSSWKFYSMKTFSKDIKNLLDHLKIKKTHLFGHSLGGAIVQRFTIMHPKMVKKLVLFSPDIGAFKRKLPSRKIVRMLIRGLKSDAQMILHHAFFTSNIDGNKNKMMRRAVDCVDRMFRYFPMSKIDYTKQLFAAYFFNTWKKVEEIKNPTLILTGEQDKIILPENAIRLSKRLPNSTLSIIPNCGHFFLYDDLKPLLPELFEFLGAKSK